MVKINLKMSHLEAKYLQISQYRLEKTNPESYGFGVYDCRLRRAIKLKILQLLLKLALSREELLHLSTCNLLL
jgi:hypothetical protein